MRAYTPWVVAHPRLPPDPLAMRTLEQLGRSGLLAAPPVALPDLHVKPRLETPSSTAMATKDTIVLGLSSPSQGCGMALASTALTIEDVDDDRIDALFGELRERMPLKRAQPMLSPARTMDMLWHGAAAAIERYDLPASTLEWMDQRGNALPADTDIEALRGAIPSSLVAIGGWEFGQVGRGNHFLELQVVAEVFDAATARTWGVTEGQLVVMYHADSGHLGAFVGRLYAYRRKNTWRGRLYEWRIKLPFQLWVGRKRHLWRRLNYHVLPHRWMPIPVDSEEGQRTLVALQAAANYAYANRVAVLATLGDGMQAVWGKGLPTPKLVWDAPHNTIRREVIGGRSLWVHRHNAARVLPPAQVPDDAPWAQTGQPVLLPGTAQTSSYLVVGGEGAEETLHSVAHGMGRSALVLGRPLSNSYANATRVYTGRGQSPTRVPHLSDDGVEAVLQVLVAAAVIRPVARLRPLAVLKWSR